MLKSKAILLIPALAFLAGCAGVVSLHPLTLPNDKQTVFDPALLGTWEDGEAVGDGPKGRYTVARSGSGYSFSVETGTGEMQGTMYLVKVHGGYLMDVYCPGDGPSLPAHFFARLRLEKDTAWVALMDSDWLQDQIKARGEPRYELLTEDHPRVVLTASSNELRQYLLPYADDDRSFGEEGELRRVSPAGK